MTGNNLKILTAIFVMLGVIPSFSRALAQDSARELGLELAEKIKSGDREGLAELIDPEALSYLEKNEPGRVSAMLDAWTEMKIPGEYEINVRPPSEIKHYDPEKKIYGIGDIEMYFPVAPESFIELSVEREGIIEVDGEKRVARGMSVISFDAARQNRGRWYLVIPVMVK